MTCRTLLSVLICTSILGCEARKPVDNRNDSQDIESINALLKEHIHAVNTSNTDLNLSGFTEDVVYMPPNVPALIGKSALKSLVDPFYEEFKAKIDMDPEETIVSGDWAFQWGSLNGHFHPIQGGDTTLLDSKFVYLYHRQPGGQWKIARDIYNSNTPDQ